MEDNMTRLIKKARNGNDKCCICIIGLELGKPQCIGITFGMVSNELQHATFPALSEKDAIEKCEVWVRAKLGDNCVFGE